MAGSSVDEVLAAEWPTSVADFWMRQSEGGPALATQFGWYTGLRSNYLPLLQSEHLVQCAACKRPVVAEHFAAHQALCSTLPLRELLAQESGHGRPKARPSNGVEGRTQLGASPSEGLGLDLDAICGVRRGNKGGVCERPLGCKYHTLAQKRLVVGRSRPFDELHQNRKRPPPQGAPRPAQVPSLAAGGAGGEGNGPESPSRPDPAWEAEWARLLEAMPPYPEAVTTTSRPTRAWPAPLCGGHRSAAKSRRLWGVPVAALAKGPPPVVSQLSR